MSHDDSQHADQSIGDEVYRILSIVAVRAPEGCLGNDWHVYRIARGENGITGYRRGNLAGVTAEVETIVTGLNGRRQWTKSKALTTSERRTAAAARRAAAR
jgi:hypothetical protein